MAHQLTLNTDKLEELKTKAAALPAEKKLQESKNVTPSTSAQTITPDSGYDGLAKVEVSGDSNLSSNNIAEGVSIFGVVGSLTAGEDVTSETNVYTGLLTDLETAINDLPEAGTALETCTVEINFLSSGAPRTLLVQGTTYTGGALSVLDTYVTNIAGSTDVFTIHNVVKNTAITITGIGSYDLGSTSCNNCELVRSTTATGSVYVKITEQDATISISNYY